jgi:hypothetical protein
MGSGALRKKHPYMSEAFTPPSLRLIPVQVKFTR